MIDHDHYRIVETSRGLVMFEPGGHISRNDAIALSTAFPDCTVYIVNHLAKYGGFVVMRYQRGVVTGTFDWPRREFVDDEYVPPFPELDDIEGETEPLRILAKLGVDPSLVRYPAHA